MDDVRVACTGVQEGPLTIPPFVLRHGQTICMQIPNPVGQDIDLRLSRLLLGRQANSGLRLNGPVRWVDCTLSVPQQPRWFESVVSKIMPRPRAVDWLLKNGRMSKEEALAVLGRLGMPPQWRTNRFPGTPKVLMNLEAAHASGAAVIVLSLSGLDPLGRQAVFGAVTERLGGCAVIYLAYPYFHKWQLYQDEIPGTTNLALGYRGSHLLVPLTETSQSNLAS